MKCPNCQTENPDLAKFCKGCGAKLEAPTAGAAVFCKACGEPIKQGAKFCPKCGTGVAAPTNAPVPPTVPTPPPAKPVYEGPNAIVPPTAPVPPKAPAPPTAPVPPVSAPVPPTVPTPPPAKPVYEGPNAIVPPTAPVPPKAPAPQPVPAQPKAPVPQPVPAQPKAPAKEKKGASTIIIICAVVVVLAIALVVLFKTGVIGGSSAENNKKTEEADNKTTDSAETTEEAETTTEETEPEDTSLSAEELAKIMAPIDSVKDEGLALLTEEDTVGSREKLSTALNQYISIAQEYGTYDELTDCINDAYNGYVEATITQVNRLYKQDVSTGLYEQMHIDANAALDLSAKIEAAGIDVDASSIEEIMADLPANYKERYILAINELTEAESWSRSTAWAIMEDVPGLGLYDEADLDDPLRLRYAYSLAMYTRKANATDIESGSLSPRDAGMKILDSIDEMDYNPVLILDAADYFKQAGENYTANVLYSLYDELTSIIEYYQGLRIPSEIPWERYWYFNDFGEYSVDDRNGASAECRQEIRIRAQEVLSSL